VRGFDTSARAVVLCSNASHTTVRLRWLKANEALEHQTTARAEVSKPRSVQA